MLKLISQGDVIQFEGEVFTARTSRSPICNNGNTTSRLVPAGRKPQHKAPFSRLPSAKMGKGLDLSPRAMLA